MVPSGDQAGRASSVASVVSLVCAEPLAFIVKMSRLTSRKLAKEILLPSGDQAGWRSWAGLFVTFVGADPSAFMT